MKAVRPAGGGSLAIGQAFTFDAWVSPAERWARRTLTAAGHRWDAPIPLPRQVSAVSYAARIRNELHTVRAMMAAGHVEDAVIAAGNLGAAIQEARDALVLGRSGGPGRKTASARVAARRAIVRSVVQRQPRLVGAAMVSEVVAALQANGLAVPTDRTLEEDIKQARRN